MNPWFAASNSTLSYHHMSFFSCVFLSSSYWIKWKWKLLRRVQLFVGLYSPGNSPGQNTGVSSLSLSPGDLPNPRIESRSPALQADSLPAEPQGKLSSVTCILFCTFLLWPLLCGPHIQMKVPVYVPCCPSPMSSSRQASYFGHLFVLPVWCLAHSRCSVNGKLMSRWEGNFG